MSIPLFVIKIENVIEDDPKHGKSVWIDLLDVENLEHINFLVDEVTGKIDYPHPDAWNDAGTFDVTEVCGLSPGFAAMGHLMVDLVGGPKMFLEIVANIASALQEDLDNGQRLAAVISD